MLSCHFLLVLANIIINLVLPVVKSANAMQGSACNEAFQPVLQDLPEPAQPFAISIYPRTKSAQLETSPYSCIQPCQPWKSPTVSGANNNAPVAV